MSGIIQRSDDGMIWAIDTDGEPVSFRPEGVLSARENKGTHDPQTGRPYVTLVWLKGHRRHVAIECSYRDFAHAMGAGLDD